MPRQAPAAPQGRRLRLDISPGPPIVGGAASLAVGAATAWEASPIPTKGDVTTERQRARRLREAARVVARDYFVRNAEGGQLFEAFFVSAVAAVLAIRFFLQLTGFPQLGGAGLHIAHILWGGLLMLVALVILLAFLSPPLTRVAAVIGGFGFGTFIDELGKFVTSDNNYFFRPTFALIYGVFVVLFLVVRFLDLRRPFTRQEYLTNALELMKELVREDLDAEEKRRVEAYLSRGDPDDPLVVELRHLLARIQPIPPPTPGLVGRIRRRVRGIYGQIIAWRWFQRALVAFFAGYSVVTMAYTLDVSIVSPYLTLDSPATPSIPEVAMLGSSCVVTVCIAVGIVQLAWSRLRAYRMFRLALLVSIFFTQFFTFYVQQLAAVLGFGLSILTLEVIRYLIRDERRRSWASTATWPQDSPSEGDDGRAGE